jgi:hypothetical protein
LGEQTVITALHRAGWIAALAEDQGGDVAAVNPATGEALTVEVKTARQCKDGKYRATVRKDGKRRGTGYPEQSLPATVDYLVMLCVNGDLTAFCIPAHLVTGRQLCITSAPATYTGKWARWRCGLDDLAGMLTGG